ncbi:MAG TPA: hypothetical protein VNG90_05335 [Candidatus Acidoferrum sp.]|nr:hypothetical protein [Candidatus Acidoferrum sp.]
MFPSEDVLVEALQRRGFERRARAACRSLMKSGLNEEQILNGKLTMLMAWLGLSRYEAGQLRQVIRLHNREWWTLHIDDDDPLEDRLRTVTIVNLMGEQGAAERIRGALLIRDPLLTVESYSQGTSFVSPERLGYIEYANVAVLLLTLDNLFNFRYGGEEYKQMFKLLGKLAPKGLPKIAYVRLTTLGVNPDDPILGRALCLPAGDQALSQWSDKDAAYLDVVDGILNLVRESEE